MPKPADVNMILIEQLVVQHLIGRLLSLLRCDGIECESLQDLIRELALLQFHERCLTKERYQDLLGQLLGHEGTECLDRLYKRVQVLECWILEDNRQFSHRFDNWTRDIVQVLPVDLS